MFFSSLPNTAVALPNRTDRSCSPRWIPRPNICQSSQGVHHWWKIRARQRKGALQSSSDWWWAQTAGTLSISHKEVPEIWRKRSAALSTYKKSSTIRSWTLLLAGEREEIAITSARKHPHWKTNHTGRQTTIVADLAIHSMTEGLDQGYQRGRVACLLQNNKERVSVH